MNGHDSVEEIKAQTDRAVRDALDEYPNALYHDIGYAKEGEELTDEPAIVVTVSEKVDEEDLDPEDVLPKEIGGYRVDVIEQQAVPDIPGDHRREDFRPFPGGVRFTAEDGPQSGTVGLTTVERGSDSPLWMSNWHNVAEEHTADPSPIGTEVYQPNMSGGSRFGTVLDGLPRDPDEGSELLHDAVIGEFDDPDNAWSSTFIAGEVGDPEDAVLGEIYVTNGVRTGYRGARCTLVPETGLHNRFERSDREDWGGNSGAVWGRYDGDEGVFYPVALHHSGNSTSDPDESIATTWAALEDEWGTLSIVDDPGQPDPYDQTDDSVHEVCCYDAEVDGETVTLSLFALNSAGGAETEATVELRCESWDESEPDDDEVIDSFEIDNDSFEISYHEIDIPRVQSYRRVVFDAQWDGDNNDMGDIHVDEAPSGSYLGFSEAALDDEDGHPGGTISVEWTVKNGGESSGSTDVELLIDGSVEDSDTTASIDTGEDDSGTLEWDVGDGDEGTFSVEVETDDETVDLADVEIGESVVVSLTNTEPDSDGVRIFRTEDPDSEFAGGYVEVADVGPAVTEYHDRDLPEGASELRYAVVAYSRTGGDEIESPPGLSPEVDVGDPDGIPDPEANHEWLFDEGEGSTVADRVGDLDGTLNGPSWASVDGVGDQHLDFDGDSDYVELPSDSASDLSHWIREEEGTFACWIDPSSNENVILMAASNLGSPASIHFRVMDDDSIQFRFRGDSSSDDNMILETSTGDVDIDSWQFVAGVADGDDARVYIATGPDFDVAEIGTESIPSMTGGDLSTEVWFGREPTDDRLHYEGGLDLPLFDSVPWSESELQDWVDETADFYGG